MGMGFGGIRLLSTIVGAPVVTGVDITLAPCRVLAVCAKVVTRRLVVKAKKHGDVTAVPNTKLKHVCRLCEQL